MDILAHIKEETTLSRLLSHMKAVREHWPSVVYMKEALSRDDGLMFLEAWDELGGDDIDERKRIQKALYISTEGGGIWTTQERALMRKYWLAGVTR